MKQLIEMELFAQLNKGTINPGETVITPLYENFVYAVTSLCIYGKGAVSAYFTLHYTRLELEALQSRLSTEGAGEKCGRTKLYNPMPFVHQRCLAMG